LRIPLKERIGGEREGDFTNNIIVQIMNFNKIWNDNKHVNCNIPQNKEHSIMSMTHKNMIILRSRVPDYVCFLDHVIWCNLLVIIHFNSDQILFWTWFVFFFFNCWICHPRPLNVLEWSLPCRVCWVCHLACPSGHTRCLTEGNGQGLIT
jgi:hypothetical protein